MIQKKILLPILMGSALFLGACGEDESAPISPFPTPVPESSAVAPIPASSAVVPPPASSAVAPIPESSAVAPVPESSAAVPPPASSAEVAPPPASSASAPTPNPVNYAPLATSANKATASSIYALWKGYHFVTKDAESAYYASIAGDYKVVFPATYDDPSAGA